MSYDLICLPYKPMWHIDTYIICHIKCIKGETNICIYSNIVL